jgi:RNA polymerase sigma-70 factor (ECF subfamily)
MESITGRGTATDAGMATSAADLERFVTDHYGRLIGLAALVCGDVGSADDIVQSALERAWRARHTLRAEDRTRPWLDRIVVREAARERRGRLRWLDRIVASPAVTELPIEPAADLRDAKATRFTDRAAMRIAFADLSRPQRAVVVLTVYAGYSIDEAAALLGVPRDTVRSRLRSARTRLREALEEVG